jgi:rhodanese-related sulfurtransferase
MKPKVIFILTLLIVGAGCTGKSSNSDAGGSLLSPADFQNKFTPDAVILDVRTQEEFLGGNLPNSLNLDFKNAEFEKNIQILDKEKTYLVYCASGVRSSNAMDLMKQAGFKNVFALKGGLAAWQQAGLPMN